MVACGGREYRRPGSGGPPGWLRGPSVVSYCSCRPSLRESMKLLAVVIILLGCTQSSIATDFQVEALVEMKMQLGDSHDVLSDWKDNQMSPCYWTNVFCQGNKVTKITLNSERLTGTLSPSIAKLTTLQELILDNNHITGAIPLEFGNLSSLTILNLGRNNLTGSISDSLGLLLGLQNLDLSHNYLSGDLNNFANKTNLQQLSLDSNSIAGHIPQEFGQLTYLVTLQLGRNNLNGSLPDSIGDLFSLVTMDLSENQLSGTIPSSLQNLQMLNDISLEGNYISGEIPLELGYLSSLVSLNLGRNDLNGSIPDSFGGLRKLQKLDLSRNRLTGNISSTLTGLQSLNYINLSYNNLSGEIPVQLLQVAEYDFTGNSLNCGQPSIPCAKRATSAGAKSKGWMIPTIVSLVAVFICFILLFGWTRRQRRGKQSIGYKLKVNVHRELEIEGSSSNFTIFEFSQVLEATNGFSVENKLGQGGFGPVYKGQFPDGLEIAVKRLASHSGQGLREFKNEVQLIAKLQHRNLVRLMGCCSQGDEKMLIYEYLPNKSLDFFIFDQTRRPLLNWSKRITIIEGIAQGLLYLHKHSRLRVIHRDVKASNILLDSEMNPKISDFGLAKMFNSNDTEGNTKRVVGTYGYMAPEYASEGLYSIKSDVFSFGVLILEIITGKRNSGFHQHEDFLNLLGYAWQLWSDGSWLQLVDASLIGESHQALEMMMRCINIALLCVQENAVDRSTMTDVVAMLSSASMVLPEPNHPAYFHVRVEREEASASAEQCSANGVTISSPRGR